MKWINKTGNWMLQCGLRQFFILAAIATVTSVLLLSCSETKQEKLNILFVIIDDLNTDISANGGPIKTPNIDKLALSGMQFTRAYVQQPVCAASRASFLTGLRPNTTGVDYPYSYYFVEELLPKHGIISDFFNGKGYHVKQFGKVHHGLPNEYQQKTTNPQEGGFVSDELNQNAKKFGRNTLPPYEKTVEGEEEFIDYAVATDVIKELQSIDKSKPFCMLAGFEKPHLAFSAPEEYWDLYDRDEISLPVPKELAEGAPRLAVNQYYLSAYKWETNDKLIPFSDNYAKLIKHAYYASASFVDHQVGRVIKALEENDLDENTIVLLISDHGFLIGEQNYWGKNNLFEKGLRVPFIVSWKGKVKAGMKTDALVEAVDIFPTVVDLAGFTIPEYLEGTSVKPLLNDPDRAWKSGVYSQSPRGWNETIEGVSLRTDQYRYNEWFERPNKKIIARELYDYRLDTTESRNLVEEEAYSEIVAKLSIELNEGWKAKLPEGIVNRSKNQLAPPAYAWGKEGKSRRVEWHKSFGGSEEDGWRASTKLRTEQERIKTRDDGN